MPGISLFAAAGYGRSLATLNTVTTPEERRMRACRVHIPKVEARLNALPQFVTTIDGLEIHFIQVRSKHARRRVRCSYPIAAGHGFSEEPATTGWDPIRFTRGWTVLMKRLGYTRFVAQGGEWGNAVTEQMALQAPPELIGIHTDMPATIPAGVAMALRFGELPPGLSAEERGAWEQFDFFYKHGLGYAQEMVNRPQTLYGIADSQVGPAASMVDHDAPSRPPIGQS